MENISGLTRKACGIQDTGEKGDLFFIMKRYRGKDR